MSNKILLNSVINGDCFKEIKKIKDNSIDLIATDPPYQINYNDIKWDKKNSIDWDVLSQEFKRVIKKDGNIIIFQGWSEVLNTINVLNKYFKLRNWIIYDRIKGRGTKKNLISTREDILWYTNSEKYTYNKISSTILKKTGGSIGNKNGNKYRAMSNVWTDISPIVPWSKEREEHPTQKPLALIKRIINIFSNKGDTVLDPFCGCGTTCVASQSLDRQWIGIEKEEKYYKIIKERKFE